MNIKKYYSSNGFPYFSAPLIVNIQLSNYCPFNCSFCFMPHNSRDDMPMSLLQSLLSELNELGCRTILFGQGEPMVSGDIIKAVELAHNTGFDVRIATSGAGCTYNKLRRLQEAGLTELHISINSFDETINQKTRAGYDLAINAIKIAASIGMHTMLNYVAQDDTIDLFPQYVQQASKYSVSGISVLREKVNRNGVIGTYKKCNLEKLASYVLKSDINVEVEACFCELRLFLKAHNSATVHGCSAGKSMMAIGTDGSFYPCSHLPSKAEHFANIKDYWNNSQILTRLREMRLDDEPCCNCKYVEKCTPCQALYPDLTNSYHISRINCPVFQQKQSNI